MRIIARQPFELIQPAARPRSPFDPEDCQVPFRRIADDPYELVIDDGDVGRSVAGRLLELAGLDMGRHVHGDWIVRRAQDQWGKGVWVRERQATPAQKEYYRASRLVEQALGVPVQEDRPELNPPIEPPVVRPGARRERPPYTTLVTW